MQFIHNNKDDSPSDFSRIKRKRTQLSQRERFLQELSKFASDSDDGHEEDANITEEQRSNQQGKSAIAGSFFEQATEEEERYHTNLNRSSAPKHVGISLIKGMRTANPSLVTPGFDSTANDKNSTDTYSKEFKVVETYSPLTTGGFFDTSIELMNISVVKIGDVLCLLSTISVNSSTSPPTGSPSIRSPFYYKTEKNSTVALTAQGGEVNSRNGEVVDKHVVSSPISAKTESFKGIGEVLTPAHASKVLQRFTAEIKLTEEERTYGKKASVEMVNQLFEVTRLDRDNHTLEGLFLNGSRRVLRVHEVRLAGFVERKLYRKWKEDPTSQPVRTIEAVVPIAPISQTGESAPLMNISAEVSSAAAMETEGGTGGGKPNGINSSGSTEGTPVVWWVIPNLIVRIVADKAGEWYGKKCVVRSIDRKNNKVRMISLDLWPPNQPNSSQFPKQKPLPLGREGVVEVVGVQGLETVLPKKGESGLVVLGPYRGEFASVITRLHDMEGNLEKLKVQCTRTGDVFHVEPHELCLIARRQSNKD
ncbi:unnamed protein product [Phytomonas sp. Hart1]|nr:unnamed protein product [Phytomonas sp. Hart1]|eukprot:CCW66054.1 unnamed protein product [Phytomonas sp. isolate Hart1]